MNLLLVPLVQLMTVAPPVWVQGALSNLGGPVDGTYDLIVTVYDADEGGSAVATQLFLDHPVADGVFHLPMTSLAVETVRDTSALWVAVKVEGDPELPRVALGAVPLALWATGAAVADLALVAENAKTADHALLADSATVASDLACTGCLAGTELAPLAVTTDKLGPLAVTTDKLAPGAVTAAKLGLSVFAYSFCNVTNGIAIPGSEGALFCALTYVDDDNAESWCQVYPQDGQWYARTGSGCGGNACGAYCLK
ncbi:MAG: hypothetical protein IV100_18875 [Myxococcales bacterium]|nr:hypothetical protein [Myxococcales bacterium]